MEGKEVPSHYEYKLLRKDGEIRDVEVKIIKLPDDKTLACRIDITEKKKWRKSLKNLRRCLEPWLKNLWLAYI